MSEQRRNLSQYIRDWIGESKGRFDTRQLDHDCGITTTEHRDVRRHVIMYLIKDGKIEAIPSLHGVYRSMGSELTPIDWQAADEKNVVSLKFPFQLERYVRIFPGQLIVVAGEKSSGKTGFLYDLVLKNMHHEKGVTLFNSETGPAQMKKRFLSYEVDIPSPPPWKTYMVYSDFADMLDPDGITVIDYLDIKSEFYRQGEEMDKIFKKLNTGVAVIGEQKPPPTIVYYKGKKRRVHRDLAYGGGTTIQAATLYLSLDKINATLGRLKIVDCKEPVDGGVNPSGMQWSFNIDSRGRFYNIAPYMGLNQEEYEED